MMAKAKPDYEPGDPWYVYFGNWLSFNSQSKNFGNLIFLMLVCVVVWAVVRWGGPFFDQKISESKAAAAAWETVAKTVVLSQERQDRFYADVADAHQLQYEALKRVLEELVKNDESALEPTGTSALRIN